MKQFHPNCTAQFARAVGGTRARHFDELATAGLILGYVGIAFVVLAVIIWIVAFGALAAAGEVTYTN